MYAALPGNGTFPNPAWAARGKGVCGVVDEVDCCAPDGFAGVAPDVASAAGDATDEVAFCCATAAGGNTAGFAGAACHGV